MARLTFVLDSIINVEQFAKRAIGDKKRRK